MCNRQLYTGNSIHTVDTHIIGYYTLYHQHWQHYYTNYNNINYIGELLSLWL